MPDPATGSMVAMGVGAASSAGGLLTGLFGGGGSSGAEEAAATQEKAMYLSANELNAARRQQYEMAYPYMAAGKAALGEYGALMGLDLGNIYYPASFGTKYGAAVYPEGQPAPYPYNITNAGAGAGSGGPLGKYQYVQGQGWVKTGAGAEVNALAQGNYPAVGPYMGYGYYSSPAAGQQVFPGYDSSQNALARLQDSPGYKDRLEKGLKALDRSAAARGMTMSGAQAMGINEYAQNYATGEYQNRLNQLAQLFGGGQTMTQSAGNAAIGAAGQFGNIMNTGAGNIASSYLAQDVMNQQRQNALAKNLTGMGGTMLGYGLSNSGYGGYGGNALAGYSPSGNTYTYNPTGDIYNPYTGVWG